MITAYHRPEKVDEALALLARTDPNTRPLGGGTVLNQASDIDFEVVDLQALGIDKLKTGNKTWKLGAALTLQNLLDAEGLPKALSRTIQHQATYNTRQVATVAGTLVSADGRSAFTTAMLALDAQLEIAKQGTDVQQISIGDLLPLREELLNGALIVEVAFPAGVRLDYQYVARSPADLPIVCAAVAQWPSGRTRVALGGYGSAPLLAMDGPTGAGAETAALDAYREAGDSWASSEYRSEMASKLISRCMKAVS